ncbi:MAG: hypothetical protein ABEJ05_03405 [Haloglomus sp.]
MTTPDPDDPLGVLDDENRDGDRDSDRDGERRRHRFRLATGLLFLALAVVWFRGPLAELWPRLWPPQGARWATLVLVVALSLVLPMMIGAALADLLYRRRQR